jgi:chaperonin cofactor prefoldin
MSQIIQFILAAINTLMLPVGMAVVIYTCKTIVDNFNDKIYHLNIVINNLGKKIVTLNSEVIILKESLVQQDEKQYQSANMITSLHAAILDAVIKKQETDLVLINSIIKDHMLGVNSKINEHNNTILNMSNIFNSQISGLSCNLQTLVGNINVHDKNYRNIVNVSLPEIKQELEAKFIKEIDLKISGINEQLSGVNEQLSGVNEQLSGVNEQMSGVSEQLSGVNERITMLESVIDTKVKEIYSDMPIHIGYSGNGDVFASPKHTIEITKLAAVNGFKLNINVLKQLPLVKSIDVMRLNRIILDEYDGFYLQLPYEKKEYIRQLCAENGITIMNAGF